MFQVEVLDTRQPVPNWRGVCITDEAEAGLMFAFSDRSPARPDDLDDAIDLAQALHAELGVRAGVRSLRTGQIVYDCLAGASPSPASRPSHSPALAWTP